MTNDKDGAPAAQPDVLGEKARNKGVVDTTDGRMEPEVNLPIPGNPVAEHGEAKPGRDENQAGFVNDPDKRFSP